MAELPLLIHDSADPEAPEMPAAVCADPDAAAEAPGTLGDDAQCCAPPCALTFVKCPDQPDNPTPPSLAVSCDCLHAPDNPVIGRVYRLGIVDLTAQPPYSADACYTLTAIGWPPQADPIACGFTADGPYLGGVNPPEFLTCLECVGEPEPMWWRYTPCACAGTTLFPEVFIPEGDPAPAVIRMFGDCYERIGLVPGPVGQIAEVEHEFSTCPECCGCDCNCSSSTSGCTFNNNPQPCPQSPYDCPNDGLADSYLLTVTGILRHAVTGTGPVGNFGTCVDNADINETAPPGACIFTVSVPNTILRRACIVPNVFAPAQSCRTWGACPAGSYSSCGFTPVVLGGDCNTIDTRPCCATSSCVVGTNRFRLALTCSNQNRFLVEVKIKVTCGAGCGFDVLWTFEADCCPSDGDPRGTYRLVTSAASNASPYCHWSLTGGIAVIS